MDKILEFLDYLITATQTGLHWDFIKLPEVNVNQELEYYYTVLDPEHKDKELLILKRDSKKDVKLTLNGETLVINISTGKLLSVEVETKLKVLYDEVQLYSIPKDKLEKVYEELNRTILKLG